MRKHLLAFISLIALTTCSGSVPAMAGDTIREAVEEINGMDQSIEHATAVYSDGSYADVVTGNDHSVSVPLVLSKVPPSRYKDIVGLVHSHPKAVSDNPVINAVYDKLNQEPSPADDGVGSGMCFFLAMVGSTSPHFDMIVIGPDDVARTYRYECQ